MPREAADWNLRRASWDAFEEEVFKITDHDVDDVLEHVFPNFGRTADYLLPDLKGPEGEPQYRLVKWQDISKWVGLHHSNDYQVLYQTAKIVGERFNDKFAGYSIAKKLGLI